MKDGNPEAGALNGLVDLSVVIPAFNEEHRLPQALALLASWLEEQHRSYELILVDDGSTDRTLEIMRAAERELAHVRVVTRHRNRGKGRTLADGVAVSRGNVVLVSDADLSTPLGEFGKLEAALNHGADVAIASRGRKESQIEVAQPIHRVLMGKVFNLLVQALLLPGIWDTQCGFKLLRGPAARELFGALKTDGFAFDVEILYRARRQGLLIAEVPVRWLHSAPSRVGPVRDSLGMFVELLQIRFRTGADPGREREPAADASA